MKKLIKTLAVSLAFISATSLPANPYTLEDFSSEELTEMAEVSPANRIIQSVNIYGKRVDLDNGASWTIHGAESQKNVRRWRLNDIVIIHPTLFPRWSGTQYYLYNTRTRTSAAAVLTGNPYRNDISSIYISDINYTKREMRLIDGDGRTVLVYINPRFSSEFRKWRVGQHIMIGSNQDCYAGWLSNYPYILINVERNHPEYIEAIFN